MAARNSGSVESALWDDKSPFSVFGRSNGASSARPQENQQGHHLLHQQQRHALGVPTPPPGQVSGRFSPFAPHESPILHQQRQVQQPGGRPRTLQEIEEEMLLMAAAQAKQREREAEEREAEKVRNMRRREAEIAESLPEEDEDTTDEDEPPPQNIEDESPKDAQIWFVRLIKERFIYGLLDVSLRHLFSPCMSLMDYFVC